MSSLWLDRRLDSRQSAGRYAAPRARLLPGIPKGLKSLSPGLRGTSYPGTSFKQNNYRNAVASSARQTDAARFGITAKIVVSGLWLDRRLDIGQSAGRYAAPRAAFAEIPKGLKSLSPGLRGTSYPGTSFKQNNYRNAVASSARQTDAARFGITAKIVVSGLWLDRRLDIGQSAGRYAAPRAAFAEIPKGHNIFWYIPYKTKL